MSRSFRVFFPKCPFQEFLQSLFCEHVRWFTSADALDFGRYALLDVRSGGAVHLMLDTGLSCGLMLDEVEGWLAA
jgi:hypothetical protein